MKAEGHGALPPIKTTKAEGHSALPPLSGTKAEGHGALPPISGTKVEEHGAPPAFKDYKGGGRGARRPPAYKAPHRRRGVAPSSLWIGKGRGLGKRGERDKGGGMRKGDKEDDAEEEE